MARQFQLTGGNSINARRSVFDLSRSVLFDTNVGDITPSFVQEVYPGDTFSVSSNCVIRTPSSLERPFFGNLFIDTYYFFVPNRLVFNDWEGVFGENKQSYWARENNAEVPTISGSVYSGTVPDYLGVAPGRYGSSTTGGVTTEYGTPVQALRFRAFALIYNEWFRDENNIAPTYIQTGGSTSIESFNNNPWGENNYCGLRPKAGKIKDIFTAALPSPQKGEAVQAVTLDDFLPLSARDVTFNGGVLEGISPIDTIRFARSDSMGGLSTVTGQSLGLNSGGALSAANSFSVPSGLYNEGTITGTNLGIDASDFYTINDLRVALATQRLLEIQATAGTRYVEFLASMFNVRAADARVQRSEYLGGKRTPIQIQQAISQNGGTDDIGTSGSLGRVGAWSLTNASSGFRKSFVEHGYVIGVSVIRQRHIYQQGNEKALYRTKQTDFYNPLFANIGLVPIRDYELYAGVQGDNGIFGYNEAWYDLRYAPNSVRGHMRNAAGSGSLDMWHIADDYTNTPVLSKQFIEETDQFFNKQMVSEDDAQFIIDMYHKVKAVRELPVISTPSLTGFRN